MTGAETACVLVRRAGDLQRMFPVAGHGIAEEVIGRPLEAEGGLSGRVLGSEEPVVVTDYSELVGGSEEADSPQVGWSAPIRCRGTVRGALSVATTAGDWRFDGRELTILCELADLAGAALEHGEVQEVVEPAVQAHFGGLAAAIEADMEALASAVDTRDGYTGRYSQDLVRLTRRVGERLGLAPHALADLEYAARFHRVGKARVGDETLGKHGPLDNDDWVAIKRHPRWGAEMLARVPGLEVAASIVWLHQERWDGSGYPHGLEGERIPLGSRVIAVCGAYQAMVSDRPYRPELDPARALGEVEADAGKRFDPRVVAALMEVVAGS